MVFFYGLFDLFNEMVSAQILNLEIIKSYEN